jgi:ATP-dependent DNA helicase RecG
MTATPIPRSLQLTIFGDLDISILDELPKGRRPIKTEIISPVSRSQMNEKIAAELAKGRQIYWVVPLIDDNETAEKESVGKVAKKLMTTFKGRKIGLLPGQLNAESKDAIMREFQAGEIDILVATTVVEVGVDVANASVMAIENADQFGLSQLHQLRGRVGRGEQQSFCFLIQSDSSAPSRRLREVANSTDGFHLAEIDLELRGAGEIYGVAQHGSLNLNIANLSDTKLIARASKQATKFADEISKNPELLLQYKELNREIQKYQRLTTLN